MDSLRIATRSYTEPRRPLKEPPVKAASKMGAIGHDAEQAYWGTTALCQVVAQGRAVSAGGIGRRERDKTLPGGSGLPLAGD
jgi:hypothetical protein